MNQSMKRKIHAFVINSLHADFQAFDNLIDESGEVNYTQLAEELAYEFSLDEHLDDETHWIWDVALDEGEFIEKRRQPKNSNTI